MVTAAHSAHTCMKAKVLKLKGYTEKSTEKLFAKVLMLFLQLYVQKKMANWHT